MSIEAGKNSESCTGRTRARARHAGRVPAAQGRATPRMGTVEQGNTVCDFDDLEKEAQALDRLGRRLVRL